MIILYNVYNFLKMFLSFALLFFFFKKYLPCVTKPYKNQELSFVLFFEVLPFIVVKMKKAMRVLLMAQVDLATQDKTV